MGSAEALAPLFPADALIDEPQEIGRGAESVEHLRLRVAGVIAGGDIAVMALAIRTQPAPDDCDFAVVDLHRIPL